LIETDGPVGWPPAILRDRFGDVWVALAYEGPFGNEGMDWNHTYTSVTSTAPVVTRHWKATILHWRLSGPAPGSHWTVQRAHGRGDFEDVTSVSPSGGEVLLSWVDEDPPRGHLRYRVRRECEDVRYQWLSPESRWPRRGRGPSLLILPSEPIHTNVQIIDAAPGPLRLQVFDIQGRAVRDVPGAADGLPVSMTVVHGDLNAGVYFLRAIDQLGDATNVLRIVVLR
jgi:hypothetical protein